MSPWTLALVIVIAGWYLVLSVVSFVRYGLDKRAAIRGRWRASERSLYRIDLLGGWPGGLLGQRVWKHKRRKLRYMLRFWLGVLIHVAVWGFVAWLVIAKPLA
jgi:uncharacterized membrane protein YsdA (DUF1294 family)